MTNEKLLEYLKICFHVFPTGPLSVEAWTFGYGAFIYSTLIQLGWFIWDSWEKKNNLQIIEEKKSPSSKSISSIRLKTEESLMWSFCNWFQSHSPKIQVVDWCLGGGGLFVFLGFFFSTDHLNLISSQCLGPGSKLGLLLARVQRELAVRDPSRSSQ